MRGKMAHLGKWMVCLAFSYILTLLLLLLLAFIMYRFKAGNTVLMVGVNIILFMGNLLGGYLLGGGICKKKYLWGLLFGAFYFGVLSLISVLSGTEAKEGLGNFLATMLFCLCGGSMGGMLHSMH